MIKRRFARLWLLATSLAIACPALAVAHPHVLVDAKSEVVFDAGWRIASVHQIWRFDPAFSADAMRGLDEDGNGELSDAALRPLARINVESLQEFDFFTYPAIGGKELASVELQEYWLQLHDRQLTLFYELPLKTPVAVARDGSEGPVGITLQRWPV